MLKVKRSGSFAPFPDGGVLLFSVHQLKIPPVHHTVVVSPATEPDSRVGSVSAPHIVG